MFSLQPKIYVACLAAYNEGILYGSWIDIANDQDHLCEKIQVMLKNSPIKNASEWAIHDHDFGGISISENEDLGHLVNLAEFINEHQELGIELLKFTHNDLNESERLINDCYYGEHKSEEDFTRQILEETTETPSHLVNYIDYKSMADDWFLYDYFTLKVNDKVHVFCSD